ncbi:MAG: MFS transporter [Polyangiaceae bacterium]
MTTQPVPEAPQKITSSMVLLLAFGAGLTVAGLYYNQPILAVMARDLHASARAVGYVPMLTQLGYAVGIVLFAPLGDKLDRRRVILCKCAALCGSLLLAAVAPNIQVLCAASLAIGIFATAAQDFVPAAATLAPIHARGKIVGSVMTGLLLGILLSRLVSGFTADRFGWRSIFFVATLSIVGLAFVSAVRLPPFEPTTKSSYFSLLKSMLQLVRDLPELRVASLAQAFLCISFSAFWSTLALALAAPPYKASSAVAGAFGLAGAAGALMAPIAGSIADQRGPRAVIRFGAALVVASFLMMGLFQGSMLVLILGAVLFDLGTQASLISHQTIIYGLDPNARSRVNAVLVATMFLGMSAGAALGSIALATRGWLGVCELGAAGAGLSLLVRAMFEMKTKPFANSRSKRAPPSA